MKPPLEPVVATPRLLLRPPRRADIPMIVDEINDIDVVRMLARVPFPYSTVDGEAFVVSSRQSAARGTDVSLVIAHNDQAIGCIGLVDIPSANELGYWLGRAHWRRGYASEAAAGLIAWAFDELGLEKITSGVFSDNPASLRVQQKTGFEVVGESMRPSLARGHAVPHIDTVLTRERFNEFHR